MLKRYAFHGNNDPVLIAGQIHGTIFLAYIAAVVILYTSLRWSRQRTLIAGLASVPPFGSLVFEQWAAHKRRSEALKTFRQLRVWALMVQGNQLFAVQTAQQAFWTLPGGNVGAKETAEVALARLLYEQIGISARVGPLLYVQQGRRKKIEQLDLFFMIDNPPKAAAASLGVMRRHAASLDEIAYINPRVTRDLRPIFLQTEGITAHAKHQPPTVRFID